MKINTNMFHKSAFLLRYYCTNINKPYFVTTPIFYVNASPHIGHVYSAVIADCVYRFQNLLASSSSSVGLFTTGTDEHGIKIQQAAANHKQNVDVYCDNISREYIALFKQMNITYTDFIRTSENRHKLAVQELWNNLKSKEHIYSAKYSGWYCVPDETFLTDSQLKLRSDGQKVSIDSGHPVEWSEEENYMFRLSSFHDDILYWIKQGNRIKPAKFEKILLDWLITPLNDLSISRPTSRVHWGIPVPGDDTQTVYVWLDALTNYLTCAGYPLLNQVNNKWPPSLQVIGKDILKFHGIYWPAFLIAAGLEPPAQLLVHSHWTVDGEKMSKSKMNVVDPVDRIKHYTSDGLRYFLLREGVAHSDGNYSDTKVMRILNSELADTLGNLLSRCCAKSLNVNQIFPALDENSLKELIALDVTKKLFAQADEVAVKCFNHYKSYNFYLVVDTIVALLHTCNNFVETTKPWELKKGKNPKKLETIIGITLEVLRVSGIILQPVIPNMATMLLDKINIPMEKRQWPDLGELKWSSNNFSQVSKLTDSHAILFRRIIQEKAQLVPDIVKQ